MFVTYIPISQFIEWAIKASLACDYTAFLLLIARTADGARLQDQLLKQWDSFDDLTYDQILVISPSLSRNINRDNFSARVQGLRLNRIPEAIVTEGLTFNTSTSKRWDKSFFNQSESSTSSGLEGAYVPRRPGSLQEHRAAMTSVATETARFFGISEAWLPCLVILSIQEQHISFITVDESFSIYQFVRSLLVEYEPTTKEIQIIEKEILRSKDKLNESQRALYRMISNQEQLNREWDEKLNTIFNSLEKVAFISKEFAEIALFIKQYLQEEIDTVLDIEQRVEEFLCTLEKEAFSHHYKIRKDANKLRKKLPLAIQKIRGKFAPYSSANEKNVSIEIDGLEKEIKSLNKQLYNIRIKNKFSDSVISSVTEIGFCIEEANIHLPDTHPLENWQATWLRKHRKKENILATQKDVYVSKLAKVMHILHLSDLHFGTLDQANLWSNQLAADLYNDINIPHLDALILSGDIANYSTEEEYKAAQQFLHNFRQDFPLNPEQIILVPGNHDLNWKLAKKAYKLIDRDDYEGELKDGHYIEESASVIRVRDEAEYKQRFAHFSQFYETIKQNPYPLDYDQQYTLNHLPEQNLLILGLNSAWQLDHHYKSRASINTNALSNALTQIRRNPDYKNCLKIAVWHHPLDSAYSDRITDQGFLEQLAVNGFRFFLHGHIHKAETSLFRYDMSTNGRKLDRICAGTFGAPVREWVPGYPLQYNLLKIEDNQLTVYTRRREELNGAWKPDARWLQGAGKTPLDYYAIAL